MDKWRAMHACSVTFLFCLLTVTRIFGQLSTEPWHKPSVAESRVLEVAAASSEFQHRDQPNLLSALLQTPNREFGIAGIGTPSSSPTVDPERQDRLMKNAACTSNSIVLGQVTGRTSSLSADDTTVISLYTFTVQRVYKSDGSTFIGRTIGVLRKGGTAFLDQGTITQRDLSFPEFQIGSQYLLFLRHFENTDALAPIGDKDAVLSAVDPGLQRRLVPFGGFPKGKRKFETLQEFTSWLPNAIETCRGQR